MTRWASNFPSMSVTYSETVLGEIRAEMSRKRLSQEGLASRLGWTQQFVSRRLNGRTDLKITELEQIADALGADLRIELSGKGVQS